MAIMARESSSNFVLAPEGTWSAVCVDVVDLGMLEVAFGGKKKTQHKIRIVWQIEEVMNDNKPYTAQRRYTLSLHEKSSLRKDLESWRGRKFTQQELQGFDVETVISVPCMLNIIHEEKNGGAFANVASIMRLPKGLEPVKARDYIRVIDRKPEMQDEDQSAEYRGEPNEFGIDDSDIPFRWPRPSRRGVNENENLFQMQADIAA